MEHARAEEGGDAEPPTAARTEESTVRVALRVRPMLPTDLADGASECVFTTPGEPVVFLGSDRAFTFDHVFGTGTAQADVYGEIRAGALVRGALDGLNGTVFAYGQTGSGKTHTMGTASIDLDHGADDAAGILPRAMRELFGAIRERVDAHDALAVRVSATFIEIHREEVRDLLHASGSLERGVHATLGAPADELVPGGRPATAPAAGVSGAPAAGGGVTIREDASGAISLAGARQRELRSAADALRCVQHGALSRATASTAMNASSSRSHAVLTVTVDADLPTAAAHAGARPRALSAKLHFVDLAGSERAKRTKAEGERFLEGVQINRGLLALGNVICALTAERKPGAHVHVPYRDSKLTRLLQDSLGGNSQTLMLACVSPCDADLEETLNTLKYAQRARHIHNRPVVNVDLERADSAQLRLQVRSLQAQLATAAAAGAVPRGPATDGGSADAGALARRCAQLEAQAATLRAQLAKAGAEIGRLHARALGAELGDGVMLADGAARPPADADERADGGEDALLVASEPELVEADVAFAERQRRMAAQLDALSESLAAKEQIAARFDVLSRRPMAAGDGNDKGDGDGGCAELGVGGAAERNARAAVGAPDAADAEAEVARLAHVVEAMRAERDALLGALAALSDEQAATAAAAAAAPALAGGAAAERGGEGPAAGAARERLCALEASLEQARKKLSAAEALLRARASSEARLGHMQSEIREMRGARVALVKRMRAAATEHASHRRARELELLHARRAEQRMAAQLCKVAGAAERQATVLKQRTADLSIAHAKLRDKEVAAAAAAAARQHRIHAQLKPPLPGRPATAGAGAADDGASPLWLARAADVAVSLERARAQLAGHVGARRQAKRELDELDLLAAPARESAGAEPGAGERADVDVDARRDALRAELSYRSDKVSTLQQQIVALDKERAAHDARLAAHACAPQRATPALALAFRLAVDARAAEEASTLRVAEAQASLRDAVDLADGLGAQLERSRAEHARALLDGEGAHQEALRAVVDATAAGIASAPPARAGPDGARARRGDADTEAEAGRLRARILELEAELARARAPAVRRGVGAVRARAPAHPRASEAATVAQRRTARVVASDDEDQCAGAAVAAEPVAPRAPAGIGSSEGARASQRDDDDDTDDETDDETDDDEQAEEDEGSDVDWIETEEAKSVISRTLRVGARRKDVQHFSPASDKRTAVGSPTSEAEARAALGAGSPSGLDGANTAAQPRVSTRRRATSTMPVPHALGPTLAPLAANAEGARSGAGAATPLGNAHVDIVVVQPEADAARPAAAAHVAADGNDGFAAGVSSLAEEAAVRPGTLAPKRTPLGTITNRASVNAPGAGLGALPKGGTKPGAGAGANAPADVAAVCSAAAPPRRKGLYVDRRAKSDMSALFAEGTL